MAHLEPRHVAHLTPTLVQQVNAERVILFGWARAILMQLAHPLVAAGVAEHSTFRSGRVMAATRLHHTVQAMLALVFGTDAARQAAIDGILQIHRRVHGTLREAVGAYPAGTRYSAEDPSLVLWVHATLLDSVPLVYSRTVTELTEADHDRYCSEAANVAIALGAPTGEVPRTRAALRAYLDAAMDSDRLAVGAAARGLASAVLHPPFRLLTGPAAALNRTITVGLLPQPLRAAYGFDPIDGRRVNGALRLVRAARAVTPAPWRRWPIARR
ncbi:MAG: oxygenase MpaB family protein [Vicinamibacterales bacterium]